MLLRGYQMILFTDLSYRKVIVKKDAGEEGATEACMWA
jgi:hypothetical protein